MDENTLPADLVAFLKSGKQLVYDPDDCEAGQIILLPLDALTLSDLPVDSEESPIAENDPHRGERGAYPVPAVNLVSDCDGYSPDGILIWLPDQKLFGTWDEDHWDVIVFPNVTWTEIVADPVKYINAQWEPERVECAYLQPFPDYPFKAGWPWNEA